MKGWTVFPFDVECGAAGGHIVAAGDPVHVVAGAVKRCVEHSQAPVDWDAVDAAAHAIDAARAAGETPPTPQPLPFGKRIKPPRPVLPADAVMHTAADPKAAAAGDRK